VKVIREPKKFEPIPLTCPHCQAQLEADRIEDFRRESYSDFRESWDYAVTTCPCCGGGIQVNKEKFPIHLYEKLARTK
jgi:hypothetical protein